MLTYLGRFAEHMARAGFPANDPLLAKVYAAKNAIRKKGTSLIFIYKVVVGR